MALANMNSIGVCVTKLRHVQALVCGGGGGGDSGIGGTKNIIPPKFSNFEIFKFRGYNYVTYIASLKLVV